MFDQLNRTIETQKSDMKNLKWLLVMLLFLNFGNMTAQKMDSVKAARIGRRITSMYGVPNLTDDQKNKIKELRTPHAREILTLRSLLAERRAHLRMLQTVDKADLNAINSTIDEMTQLQARILKKQAIHTQALRKILTDDQRIAFDMREYSRGKFHHHRRSGGEFGKRG